MAASSVQISAQFAANKPLEVLGDLIAKREKYLKGETTENAVTATTMQVVRSLAAETTVAPRKATPDMFELQLVAANAAGWRYVQGKGRRRSPVIGGHWQRAIRPVNWMYGHEGEGNLYRVKILNPNLTPKKSLNKPVYFVLAPDTATAEKFGLMLMNRALAKEAGMAKYAISASTAKIYDRPNAAPVKPPSGSGAFQKAKNAVTVTKAGSGFDGGQFMIEYFDALRYSMSALKGSYSSLDMALKKAANSTAAIINKMGNVPLGEEIPTPFPEIAKSKASK